MVNLINPHMLNRGTKKCYHCKEHKSLSEFGTHIAGVRGGHKRGHYIDSYCRECNRNKSRYNTEKAATRPRSDKCEACGNEDELCFDHCHITGFFRGWICKPCNDTLGWAKDNPDRLRALAKYIEKFYRSEAVLDLLKAEEEENIIFYLPI